MTRKQAIGAENVGCYYGFKIKTKPRMRIKEITCGCKLSHKYNSFSTEAIAILEGENGVDESFKALREKVLDETRKAISEFNSMSNESKAKEMIEKSGFGKRFVGRNEKGEEAWADPPQGA